jgi:hypothetical protein
MQETPLRPIVYSLQFRGRITSLSSRVLEQRARAPSQVLITTVDVNGLAGRVQPAEGEEGSASWDRWRRPMACAS